MIEHVSIPVSDAKRAKALYAKALAAGGEDNGAPGYRDYSPGYYVAFVHDPDGNNVEAVFFDQKGSGKAKK